MERNSRRHSTGFGYIGFGNNQNVFNQSSRKAFSNLKEKLNKETHLHYQLEFLHKTLSKEEKEKCRWYLKNKIFSSILVAKKGAPLSVPRDISKKMPTRGKKRGGIEYEDFEA